jgi:hypothetical protein
MRYGRVLTSKKYPTSRRMNRYKSTSGERFLKRDCISFYYGTFTSQELQGIYSSSGQIFNCVSYKVFGFSFGQAFRIYLAGIMSHALSIGMRLIVTWLSSLFSAVASVETKYFVVCFGSGALCISFVNSVFYPSNDLFYEKAEKDKIERNIGDKKAWVIFIPI